MSRASETSAAVAFGRFLVRPYRRELLVDGQPAKLGGRAFDLLMCLIEARGAVVTKDALMARIWPGRIVEGNNLQSHISALRAALGPDRDLIRTVSGRGYQFIGEIRTLSEGGAERASLGSKAAEAGALPPTNVPEPVSELIGRDDELAEVVNLMGAHRLVALTGAGGVGKTRLAVAAARVLRPRFADGVWLAQFSPLADPGLVPAAVATAVGLVGGEGSVQSVAQALAGRRLLLVLDTCEHVIEVAASMAEAALRASPELRILATTREPLKAEGEWVYSVPPLAVPTANVEQGDFFKYGSIRLFLERARAANPRFAPDGTLVELVGAICRRLDGIPLAIELAAARVPALDVEELAARLDDRFRLLTGGRRTALPRHQTLRATFDWSYDGLSEPERVVLRRLAVFAGTFDLEAVRAIVTDPEIPASAVVDGIAGLVAKSLLQAEIDGAIARYRLLDTTRAYAMEKLTEHNEFDKAARQHAAYFRDVFVSAMANFRTRVPTENLARYGGELDNVRAALDWSFSTSGDVAIGVDLTAAYAPIWMNLSLVAECRDRCEHALHSLEIDRNLNARLQMLLQIGLGNSLMHTLGPSEQAQAVLTRALETADILGDLDAQARALLALSTVSAYRGEYGKAAATTERLREIAKKIGDPLIAVVAERRLGITLITIGRLAEAQRCFEHVIASSVLLERERLPIWRQSGDRAIARAMLARALWLQGFLERASNEAQASLDELQSVDHQLMICRVLYYGICRIATMTGDFVAAEGAIARLIEAARSLNARFWTTAGQFLQGKLMVERGEFAEGLVVLRVAFTTCNETGWRLSYPEFSGSLALALAGLGRLDEADDTVTTAIAAAGRREDGQQWYVPELLRIKGEILRRRNASPAAVADCFGQAAEMAREQGSLFWELRIALSRARWLVAEDRADAASGVLIPVYRRFREGFDTADMLAAKALLDALPPNHLAAGR